MAGSDAEKRLAELESLIPQEKKAQFSAPVEADPTSDLGALAHGVGQGVTLGFSDELKAGARWLGGEDYSKALTDEQALLKKIEQFHPRSYKGGDLLGSVGLGLVPGVGLAARGAKTAMGVSAGIGALSGAGHAEEGERLAGAAQGAAFGAASGGATSLVGTTIKAAGPLAQKAAEGAFGFKAQAKTFEAAAKSVQQNLDNYADAQKKISKFNADGELAFIKEVKSGLSDIAEQSKVSEVIAKEAAKTISWGDRLNVAFKLPDSPIAAVKEMASMVVNPKLNVLRRVSGAFSDILAPVVSSGSNVIGSGVQALGPAGAAASPNLYGGQ